MLASPSALVLWLALVGSATTLHVGTPALCRQSAARSHPLLTVQTSSASAPTAKRCKRPGPKPVVPTLREVDLRKLDAGQRVQRQDLRGGSGNGYAVQDIRADPEVVWRHISDFAAYDRLIATVRTAQAYSPTQVIPGTGCYRFTVSRLRLCLDVRFCVDNDLRYAYWTLEQPSWVLSDSTGFWHVEPLADKPGYVRVWFCAAVVLAPVVPNFVVRLVSRLGLQKACSWVGSLDRGQGSPIKPRA